jgi:hypothetical protein
MPQMLAVGATDTSVQGYVLFSSSRGFAVYINLMHMLVRASGQSQMAPVAYSLPQLLFGCFGDEFLFASIPLTAQLEKCSYKTFTTTYGIQLLQMNHYYSSFSLSRIRLFRSHASSCAGCWCHAHPPQLPCRPQQARAAGSNYYTTGWSGWV